MTPSLEYLADRFDLQDLVTRYATGVDARDFAGLDSVFLPDARVDYSASGGPAGGWPVIRAWLAETLPLFSATQHLMANLAVEVGGDAATGRCMCFNPMVFGGGTDDDAEPHVMFYGLWYLLDFTRSPEGWRIAGLTQQKAYDHNVPRRRPRD